MPLKKIVDVDDVDAGMGIHPLQKVPGENHVLVVAERQQVIPSRRLLEPIRRRIVGQRDLQAAVAEDQHVGVARVVQRRRFEVEIKGAVLEIGVIRAVAIGKVAVSAVPGRLARKD